jgi:hypothetical protein
VFFSTLKPFFDEVSTSELAARQNSDENAQSARELASEKSCVRLSCVCHRSDNPNRARECDRLESLGIFLRPLGGCFRHCCCQGSSGTWYRGGSGLLQSCPFGRPVPGLVSICGSFVGR